MAVVDPQSVQETVLAWIGALGVIAGSLSGFAALVIGYYAKLKAQAAHDLAEKNRETAEKDHAMNAGAIGALQNQVTQVALLTPVLNPPEPSRSSTIGPIT